MTLFKDRVMINADKLKFSHWRVVGFRLESEAWQAHLFEYKGIELAIWLYKYELNIRIGIICGNKENQNDS
jgi:hypothetical protein